MRLDWPALIRGANLVGELLKNEDLSRMKLHGLKLYDGGLLLTNT